MLSEKALPVRDPVVKLLNTAPPKLVAVLLKKVELAMVACLQVPWNSAAPFSPTLLLKVLCAKLDLVTFWTNKPAAPNEALLAV